MILVVLAQLAIASPVADSTYSSPALRDLVNAAAVENHRLAIALPSYTAHVESELAWITPDSIDRELIFMAQQHASAVRWSHGQFDVHVTAARPAIKLQPSPVWPGGPIWLIPALYGERLPFVFPTSSARNGSSERRARLDTVDVEHPFGSTHETRYRYMGGDTVATIIVGGRSIPIVHLRVVPRIQPKENGAAFEGDLYLDATRHQIVRLRGRFVRFLPDTANVVKFERLTGTSIEPYVDISNEEVNGAIWLPHSERVDIQMSTGVFLVQQRAIWRLTATFSQHIVGSADDSTVAPKASSAHARVVIVSEDSLAQPHEWPAPLGTATHARQAGDFADVAPVAWRETGPPQFTMRASRMARLFHVDPVEGYYTGLEGTLDFHRAAPGTTFRGFGGWAWAERSARGGASITQRHDTRIMSAFAERRLDATNDFTPPVAVGDLAFAELLGFAERRDYVDRRAAGLSWSDVGRATGGGVLSAQIGVGHDQSERTRLARAPLARSTDSFPANRASANGAYSRLALDYEINPDLALPTSLSGVGMRVHYEAATGQLRWQRATLRLVHRGRWSAVRVEESLDGGIVTAPRVMPPQQLLEFGGSARLSGYNYKEFAGDRAAVASVGGNYVFPIFRTVHLPGAYSNLPAIAPGIGAGLNLGWSALTTPAARAAVIALADPPTALPISTATGTVRGSGGFGLTFFSGLMHVGFARSFELGSPWHSVVGFGLTY